MAHFLVSYAGQGSHKREHVFWLAKNREAATFLPLFLLSGEANQTETIAANAFSVHSL